MAVSCEKADFELQGPVELSCTLQKKGKNRVVLQGTVQASLKLCCTRCLVGYPFQVQSDIHLIYALVDKEHWRLKELDLSAVDLDVVEVSEACIDLEDVVRQQLYMALPVRQICSEQCKGICPECGASLNEQSCSCTVDVKNNPFAVLAALKQDK